MEQQLQHVIEEVQRYRPGSEERQQALSRLVELILRSRRICRPFNGQPLWGIYHQIYEFLRQQLASKLDCDINSYNRQYLPVRQWVNEHRDTVCRRILGDDILGDVRLKEFALEAQKRQPGTELRQYALQELVEAIRLSGRLCHPHHRRFNPQFYKLVYEEAVNQTLIYVCQKIDVYDPNRGEQKFMNWVNFRLDRKVIDIANQFKSNTIIDLPNFSDLDTLTQPESFPSIVDCLREILEQDPDQLFTKKHIKGNYNATFKTIALSTLAGKTWKEIAAELGDISLVTISSFFRRCCQEFVYLFNQCR